MPLTALKNLITLSLLSLLITILSGCLEHRYRITALPENGLELCYEARGDIPDLEDGYDLFPDSLLWQLEESIEEKEDETVHIISGMLTVDSFHDLESAFNWNRSPKDTIFFQPQFSISQEMQFFGERYLFQCLLPSRNFNLRYGDIWDYAPPECRILEDNPEQSGLSSEDLDELEEKFAAASIQWNIARYKTRFVDVWQTLRAMNTNIPDTSLTAFTIALGGWTDDIRLFLNDMDIPDPKLVELEWWSELKPIFLGRLVDLCGIDNALIIRDLADAYESEYQISKDLKDDVFSISIQIPGQTVTTNGSKADGYTTWEVQGNDILNDLKLLELETFVPNYWKIGISVFIVLLLIRIISRQIRKKNRRKA